MDASPNVKSLPQLLSLLIRWCSKFRRRLFSAGITLDAIRNGESDLAKYLLRVLSARTAAHSTTHF